MASILSQGLTDRRSIAGVLGKQLLDVITSGMYSDPRMAIREYLQNAADSIDKAREQGLYSGKKPRIELMLDGRERVITIEDNGLGINGKNVEAQLGSLGCSTKSGTDQRGFRGIGRLGGLTYCDLLRFETRQTGREPIHVVEWNGQALREQVTNKSDQESLMETIHRIAFVSERPADVSSDPERFFRVRMMNVHRFHSDLLMNVKGLREYLSQTAPVGYCFEKFPFAPQIEKLMGKVPGYHSYKIALNGTEILRPYKTQIDVRERIPDEISDIEFVECISRQGSLLCRGWFAKTGFLSALPPNMTMRGLRIRQGNIAVGDEYFLKDLFSESRFATWHVGELHVTPLLKLNARRDGFEESGEYEEFLEWASVLCRRLSNFCRQSSKERSSRVNLQRIASDLDRKLSIPFFVDEGHAEVCFANVEQMIGRLKSLKSDGQQNIDMFTARLARLRERPVLLKSVLDGRALRGKNNRQLLVDLCSRLISINKDQDYSEHLMDLLEPYLKTWKKGKAQ